MGDEHATFRFAYTLVAAIAGSITALAFLSWKEMTWVEVLLTIFVGASFAFFVTPWVAHSILGVPEGDARTISGLTYILASGSNSFLPILTRRLRKALGEESER